MIKLLLESFIFVLKLYDSFATKIFIKLELQLVVLKLSELVIKLPSFVLLLV